MTWIPKQLTRIQMAERRAEGVRLLQAGELSQRSIARHLGVSEAAVSKWKRLLDEKGSEALNLRKAPGRPPKLDESSRAKLVKTLKSGAVAAGFRTEQWTQARVQAIIKRDYSVSYHKNHISRLLHDLGWSVQKPETRALERDEELILAWIKKDWPEIKKSTKARRRDRV